MNHLGESAAAKAILALDDIVLLNSLINNPAEALSRIVSLVASRMETDACSVYLLEPDRTHLVMAATTGLHPRTVGQLRLQLDEGLAGTVAEQLAPLAVEDVTRHPRYKIFKNSGQEQFRSFLGVPVIDRGILQGVLLVQTKQPHAFADMETRVLVKTAQEIAPIISEARLFDRFIAPIQERLWSLAQNLWWSWDHESIRLFRDLNSIRWQQLNQNPILQLGEIPLGELRRRASEQALYGRISYCSQRLNEYIHAGNTWGAIHASILRPHPVAYFSAEFGLHESLPIYSGGLGILAGDHLKSASDLGVPLVGVGLFYRQGYFRQHIDNQNQQIEEYIENDTRSLPMHPAIGKDGKPVTVEVATRRGILRAKVWLVKAGRCDLLLLDSDVADNSPEDVTLTSRLYGGDDRTRIRQELLLGVGGYRALRAVGITPGVLHLNEGHSGFAIFESIRDRMTEEGIDFSAAAAQIRRGVVFTTHTPVPAGHDRFSANLIEEHLGPLRDELGLSEQQLLSWGRERPTDNHEPFCMTVLGLKLSQRANAVSSLHGQVSRSMWKGLYPSASEDSVPIGHITNGIHVPSWLAPQMKQLYDRHLGVGWEKQSSSARLWTALEKVEDGELWEAHLSLKAQLIHYTRQRLRELAEQRGESRQTINKLSKVLSHDALTIGFARRFATYKRANLLLSDMERLMAMANNPRRPVQFLFAGKAHPHDEPGKEVLRQIISMMHDRNLGDKFVFIEDYDIHVARYMVQGVDVWLNNPRRPLEASGTSGQKVILNGVLNFSVLDGWWAEAYDGLNGFAIGHGRTHSSPNIHDSRDGEDLYRVLYDEVIPLYYDRDRYGLPRAWIKRMKHAIRSLGWRFNADRMVMDYTLQCYVPAAGGTSSKIYGA